MKICPRMTVLAAVFFACQPSPPAPDATSIPDAEPFGPDFCVTLESPDVLLRCDEHATCHPPQRQLLRTVDVHCPEGFLRTCTDGVRLVHFYPASGVGLCEDVGLLDTP